MKPSMNAKQFPRPPQEAFQSIDAGGRVMYASLTIGSSALSRIVGSYLLAVPITPVHVHFSLILDWMQHMGLSPYKCGCESSFRRKSDLTRHQKHCTSSHASPALPVRETTRPSAFTAMTFQFLASSPKPQPKSKRDIKFNDSGVGSMISEMTFDFHKDTLQSEVRRHEQHYPMAHQENIVLTSERCSYFPTMNYIE